MLQRGPRILRAETPESKQAFVDANLSAAQENFAQCRVVMNHRFMLRGYWFPRALAFKLRQFYQDWKAGKRPVMLIATPPQHGKSLTVLDFAAWVAGRDPDTRIIYSSFSDRLSIRANFRPPDIG
jgi:hypothetical protein